MRHVLAVSPDPLPKKRKRLLPDDVRQMMTETRRREGKHSFGENVMLVIGIGIVWLAALVICAELFGWWPK